MSTFENQSSASDLKSSPKSQHKSDEKVKPESKKSKQPGIFSSILNRIWSSKQVTSKQKQTDTKRSELLKLENLKDTENSTSTENSCSQPKAKKFKDLSQSTNQSQSFWNFDEEEFELKSSQKN